MHFAIVSVATRELDLSNPQYQKLQGSALYTSDPLLAEPDAEGFLRWDGCVDLKVVKDHFCGLDDLDRFHRRLAAAYEIAAVEMRRFDREIAGMPPLRES